MPRNSQGLYTLPLPPVRAGELVESSWANETLDDLAQTMTDSLPRNGSAPMVGPLTLSADPITAPRQAASKEYVDQFMAYASGMFVGAMAFAPITVEPPGWLLCDGRAVSRTVYATLFAAIGTTFGAGDGSTTFNLPPQSQRYLRGAGAGELLGQLLDGSIMLHTHPLNDPGHIHAAAQEIHSHTTTQHSHGVTDPGHAHGRGESNTGNLIGGATLAYVRRTDQSPSNTDSAQTGISVQPAAGLGTDAQQPGVSVYLSSTGATVGATGDAENRPASIVCNMFIKAKDDSAGSPMVVSITSSDPSIISIDNSNPVSPELVIQSNVAFGTVKLDASGKVPLNQMPTDTFNALGFFDASGGQNPSQAYPAQTYRSGDTYIVSVAGTILCFDPVTLVSSLQYVDVGSLLQYVTGSLTNPTGWYTVTQSSTVAASSVIFAPTGGISATNVQDAIDELDTEKAPLDSPVFTGNPTAPTPSPGDNDTSIATTAFVAAAVATVSAPPASAVTFSPSGNIAATNVQAAIQELDTEKAPASAGVPTGAMQMFFMNSAPAGWLEANGAVVSRTTYAALFAAIGTLYGAGDGSTTFQLPDMRGYFPRAAGVNDDGTASGTFGQKQGDAIRNITGSAAAAYRAATVSNAGAMRMSAYGSTPAAAGTQGADLGDSATIVFDASLTVPTATENRPHNIALLCCIKA